MSDLISRQAAINIVRGLDAGFVHFVEELPSAQQKPLKYTAEPEIIRCKDCKHYVIHTLFGHRQGWCERLCDEYDKSLARGTEEDDFCSRAEERRR